MEILTAVLMAVNIILVMWAIVLLRRGKSPTEDLKPEMAAISNTLQGLEKYLRDDIQRLRTDLMNINAEMRRELSSSLQTHSETIATETRKNREENTNTLNALRAQINSDAQKNREELGKTLDNLSESLSRRLQELTTTQQTQFEAFKTTLEARMEQIRANNEKKLEEMRHELSVSLQTLADTSAHETRKNREENTNTLNALRAQINSDAQKNREELGKTLDNLSESLSRRLQDLTGTQQTQFESLKTALEGRMEQIRANNEKKLEEMRRTVDEKLHETLEKRLGDSFRIVSERLELVHKGLGEMRELANGVGDLKKVLGNVKTRGVLGEVQLEAILEQMLTPEQYAKNFKPHKRRDDIVEFAIRLPGRDEEQEAVYLPLDSKFPQDLYHHLIDSLEAANPAGIEIARRKLYTAVRGFAKDIRDKYLNPPITTDFGLMFLPFEGLFAEVIRDPALFEQIRREYQVIIVGPTTLAALLNSLQMGFRTLAIEKRSGEVWKILSAVKAEFGKFGAVLEKTQKKLQEASNVIDAAHTRSRQIERKLNKVQDMPVEDSRALLELEAEIEDIEDSVEAE